MISLNQFFVRNSLKWLSLQFNRLQFSWLSIGFIWSTSLSSTCISRFVQTSNRLFDFLNMKCFANIKIATYGFVFYLCSCPILRSTITSKELLVWFTSSTCSMRSKLARQLPTISFTGWMLATCSFVPSPCRSGICSPCRSGIRSSRRTIVPSSRPSRKSLLITNRSLTILSCKFNDNHLLTVNHLDQINL